MYFLGYDIGSSSVKACLLRAQDNQVIAKAQFPKQEMPIIALQSGWAEQNPENWWQAIIQVTKDILSKSQIKSQQIKAIGIAYQMHGLVLVDKDQKILRPSIIWCDSRAVNIGAKAHQDLGQEYCQSHLLNSPGNFTASKLAWVRQNEPDIYEQAHKFMLPGDYIAMRMSGKIHTSIAGISEGILYDFPENCISQRLLDHLDISRELIPDTVPSLGYQAELSKESAEILNLIEGTKITYRAGDQPNNALSLNVLQPRELAATAGTSGVIYGVSEELKSDAASRVNSFVHVNHTVETKRIGILLCINGTGIMNSWAQKNMGAHSYESMNELAINTPIGSKGLLVLPFGNGAERILENKNIAAHISGLELNIHSHAHIYRSIQEGIACAMRYGVDIMTEMGVTPTTIKAGKANLFLSPLFRQALSNLTNAKIELYDTDGAEGAARGAGIGYGYYNETTAFEGLTLLEEISPNNDQEAYNELYENWKDYLHRILTTQRG